MTLKPETRQAQRGSNAYSSVERGGEERRNGEIKYFKIVMPAKGAALLVPETRLTEDVIRFVYELSGGYFEVSIVEGLESQAAKAQEDENG